jgi:hypothetical protein
MTNATIPTSGSSGTPAPAISAAPMPWMLLLRLVLLVDGLVLGGLGIAFILAPDQVQSAFGFDELPLSVRYILGLWGCALVSLGLGYLVAATNPVRHVVWVQIGIVRGVLEAGLGVCFVVRGVVDWHQAGAGIAVAVLVTLAYLVLYPRRRRDIRPVAAPS